MWPFRTVINTFSYVVWHTDSTTVQISGFKATLPPDKIAILDYSTKPWIAFNANIFKFTLSAISKGYVMKLINYVLILSAIFFFFSLNPVSSVLVRFYHI